MFPFGSIENIKEIFDLLMFSGGTSGEHWEEKAYIFAQEYTDQIKFPFQNICTIFKSSRLEVFSIKAVLKDFTNSQGNTYARLSF